MRPPTIPCQFNAGLFELAGRGLGLRTSRDLKSGELAFISHPIGIAYGPRGKIPDNEELVETILRNYLESVSKSQALSVVDDRIPSDWEWIKLLAAPRSDTRSGGSNPTVGPLVEASGEAFLLQWANRLLGQVGANSDTQSVQGAESGVPDSPAAITALEITGAVGRNSYGEACEDIAVSELKVSCGYHPHPHTFNLIIVGFNQPRALYTN